MKDLIYQSCRPDHQLSDFIDSCWMLVNPDTEDYPTVVLPDGRIDLLFFRKPGEPFKAMLLGLETKPSYTSIEAGARIFAASFNLPAVEYLLPFPIHDLLDKGCPLALDFWGISAADLEDLPSFSAKVFAHIAAARPAAADERKMKLFRLIYEHQGNLTVKSLSEQVFWPARQINRYFQRQFGLSLKAYSRIIRFRASFGHLQAGKLFPEQDFTDQAHFIREVKKFAGVVPGELVRNKNDRFIQFRTEKGT